MGPDNPYYWIISPIHNGYNEVLTDRLLEMPYWVLVSVALLVFAWMAGVLSDYDVCVEVRFGCSMISMIWTGMYTGTLLHNYTPDAIMRNLHLLAEVDMGFPQWSYLVWGTAILAGLLPFAGAATALYLVLVARPREASYGYPY